MAYHPVDRHVGARLRLLRLQRGLSQKDIADGLKLTFQQVQKYENGANRISASKLFEIAALIGVPVSDFFAGLDEKATERTTSGVPSPLDYEILALLSRVESTPIKRQVRALLRELSAEADAPEVGGSPNHPARGGGANLVS
jgi:transcriptional regulator with XRE-family HTH domain